MAQSLNTAQSAVIPTYSGDQVTPLGSSCLFVGSAQNSGCACTPNLDELHRPDEWFLGFLPCLPTVPACISRTRIRFPFASQSGFSTVVEVLRHACLNSTRAAWLTLLIPNPPSPHCQGRWLGCSVTPGKSFLTFCWAYVYSA